MGMANRDTGPLYTYKELCRLGRCHARIQQRDRRGPVMEVRASRAHPRFAYEALLAFYYWILSTYPHTDGSMERAVGMLRTFEFQGNCLAYVVGSTSWPNVHQCILAFALWGTCLVPTTLAVGRVPPDKVEISEEENSHTKDVLHGDSSSEDSYRAWNEKDEEALFRMPDLDRKLTARDSVSGLPIRAPIAVHATSLWPEQAEA